MLKDVYDFQVENLVTNLSQVSRYLRPYSNEAASSQSRIEEVSGEASSTIIELEEQFNEILNLFYYEAMPQGAITLHLVNSGLKLGLNSDSTSGGLIDEKGNCIFSYRHPLFQVASYASFFSITLSRNIDEWIFEFFKGREYTKAYLLEAVALSALNEMQKQIRTTIHRTIPEGYSLSYTLTPGSHGLPISSIFDVLNLSGGRQIGISIGSEFALSPLKALTGIILAGKDFSQTLKDECNYCSQRRNCLYKI